MTEETYRIGELAELAGVTRRTVHYYINKALIPPAEGVGVGSFYTTDHLNRIRLIRKLQESYLPLDEIRKIITPLGSARVLEHLEQYERGEPVKRITPVQEPAQEVDDQLTGTHLYERVELGNRIELHFPVELREKEPAVLAALIENARRTLRNGQQDRTPGSN